MIASTAGATWSGDPPYRMFLCIPTCYFQRQERRDRDCLFGHSPLRAHTAMKVFNLTLALCLAALVSADGTPAASSDFALLLETGERRFAVIPSSTQPDSNGKRESITDNLYNNASRLLAFFESLVSPAVEHDEDNRTATGFLQLVADDRATGMDDEAVLDHLMQKIDDVLLEETDTEESTGDNEVDLLKKVLVKNGKKTLLFRALDTFWMFVRTYKVAPGLTTTTTRRTPYSTTRRRTTRRSTTSTTRATTAQTTTRRTATSTIRVTTTQTTTTQTTTSGPTTTATTTSARTVTSTRTATSTSTTSMSITTVSTMRSSSTAAAIPGGTAEVAVFLDVAARSLLNDVCRSQQPQCIKDMEYSFHQAILEETQDRTFSREQVIVGLLTPRRRGVVVLVYILEDDDLRFSSVLQKVLEDVPRCRTADPPMAICRTSIGMKFSQRRITPTVTSIRMIP
ncbi:hypothetical protein TGME49_209930 [Toxoplasma gondii ME49]|uniref:Uncharacterized protein n=4 Tax=Toxoplasma gondii TaxID=5811 RepID=A0A2G8XUL7_TOXGO|nr:hypothetical protein TGME49_209930 [Toxoplasma gondii ME49]EPT32271.1 hypothetical protein TGME49_209930 [Toxoplasma gondii ME49]KFG34765.1 hypothetical protein TGDOM2_209930 [Toxoplasma gondii GAB2-2007-GAL-DOM2]KYF41203.1 hypothetical protein TGARI_209930 [Toxoplasma gondii ARI]PIL98702.1 hypothetical protein TGCOUG_209930 [Toxoplasma gondii COUG]|eukprot:XP_002369742.2 hypothetical protein TGME49_209930 [Toxoplasma gondii ME49]